jgi:mono/diheme cytochrome c family protein
MLNAMRLTLLLVAVLFLAGSPVLCRAQSQGGAVARGSYLVNQMGKCGDCHTPRGERGMPDQSRWLKGAPLGFRPIGPVPGWASAAPDLTPSGALWKAWGEKGMVTFFETGKTPDGKTAGPPMPQYTLHTQDAQAIVAYLKSLH